MSRGAYAGQTLDGLGAVAVVAAEDNLALADVPRRTVFYIDERATPAQHRHHAEVSGSAHQAEIQAEAALRAGRRGEREDRAVTGRMGASLRQQDRKYRRGVRVKA